MRRRRRQALLAAIISLFAVGAIVGATIFANAGNRDDNDNGMVDNAEAVKAIQDYFDGQITREEALDMFLRYFASVPLEGAPATTSPQALVRSTPTPVPTATPSPTPVSGFNFMLYCANRSDGAVSGEKRVGEDLLYDMEVLFINPNRDTWEYGFFAAQSTRWASFGGGRAGGFQVVVNSYGYWQVRFEHDSREYRTYTAGSLATHEVPFNYQPGEKNLLTFLFNRAEKRYELFVNGVKVPLDLSNPPSRTEQGWRTGWGGISTHLYDVNSSPTRSHYLLGNVERVSSRVHYEDFCMVPSQ